MTYLQSTSSNCTGSKRFSFLFLFFLKQILTKCLTGYIFYNITPNELILFPTSLKFCLVYFKFYLEIFQTTFCAVFILCVNSFIFSKIGFLKRGEVFQEFEMHPAFPWPEGKHTEPRHDIFGCSLTRLSHHLISESCYFMWCDHLHECILVISMLLEMITLVMIIILMCLACIPAGNRENSALGRHEFVAGLRRDGYVWYGMVR